MKKKVKFVHRIEHEYVAAMPFLVKNNLRDDDCCDDVKHLIGEIDLLKIKQSDNFFRKAIDSSVRYQIQRIMALIFLTNIALSAIAAEQEKKMWSLVTLSGNYGKVLYYVEPQMRLVYRDPMFQQFLTNAGMGYKVASNWQLWFGQTISADSQDAVAGSFDEYRLWQQVVWLQRHPLLSVVSRTRFEERKSLEFSDWAYRLRQRVLFNKPLTSMFSIVISDEIFFNMNQVRWILTDRLDQNRAYVGVEQRLSEHTYLGIGYMNQYLSTPITQSNHVLWLNWRIDLEEAS